MSSHDCLWAWEEESTIPIEEKFPFYIRIVRFVILQVILLSAVCFLYDGEMKYFYNQCQKRNWCYSTCNEENYPNLNCDVITNTTIEIQGNYYSNIFTYPMFGEASGFKTCQGYINNNFSPSPYNRSRSERLHICTYESSYNDPNYNNYLVCIMPNETCEQVYLPYKVYSSAGDFDISYVFIAIFISNAFQYLYLFFIIYVGSIKLDDYSKMKMGAWKCFLQIILLVSSTIVILLVCWKANTIQTYGYATELWATFGLAFGIDQAKSFLFHICIWYFLLRRCGYLKVNEDDFVEEKWRNDKIDTYLSNTRKSCGKFLDNRYYRMFSVGLLIVYAVFVLIVLSIESSVSTSAATILDTMDQAFICVFLLEILLNFFVYFIKHFYDYFNVFDASIVSVSFIMYFVGQNTKGLAVLRLLRLVRLIIVLRKVAVTKRVTSNYATALEETLAILKNLKSEKKLSYRQKKELGWAIEIIENNKLYDVSIDQKLDKGTSQVSQDAEAKKWITMATKTANDPLQWFDRDLDDYLYERKRDGDLGEDKGIIEEEFRQHVQLDVRTHINLEKIFDDIDKWRFNAFDYFELCQNQMITHFIFRLFHYYGIMNKFQIPEVSLKSFCTAIFEGYSSANRYHNAIHAIDVTHRFNYFIVSGNLMKYISDLDIMAALLASIIHDFQHPGVNNEFLVKKAHAKAIRYNDISVLENHHLASAFAVLLDQNSDITIDLTEDQYWVLRTSIIKMVMSTDLKLQEETIGSFKNYRGLPNFPNNDKEKQILMNMAMRISDYGNPLQPHDLYFRWMGLLMEEYYEQGDIEDHLGLEYSAPFMNRRETNPYSTQLSFINHIVEPMAIIWVEFLPEIKEDVMTRGLLENKELLKQKAEQVPDNNELNESNFTEKKFTEKKFTDKIKKKG